MKTALIYILLAVLSVAFCAPLITMLSTSLKPDSELSRTPPTLLPVQPDPGIYRRVLESREVPVPLYARNTLIITLLSMAGTLLSSAAVAYGFSRIAWRGRNVMFAVMLATMMIPFPVVMVPTYVIFKHLGWIGSFKPLWVPAWFGSAFNIFLLRQFFLTIPRELDEAARLDGCGTWRTFWRIILPLAKPALAIVAVLHFITVWNDFLAPLIFLNHQDQFTLALGLTFYQTRSGGTSWNQLMAVSTMIVAPALVIFFVAQRAFVRGIATTGIKG
ncbi:MAG TPA: carbohydrate ABC transporter permease [Phycisphaerae bacterium]